MQFIVNTQRNQRINWNSLQKCDIEKIMRDRDLETLESYLQLIQQGYLLQKEYQNPQHLIPLVKLCYILQLLLQYLEYTKQHQELTLNELFQEIFKNEGAIANIEESLKLSFKRITKLKDQISKQKKENQILKSKRREIAYACLYCESKAFVSMPLLDAHYQRHHMDKFPKQHNNQETFLTIQTIILQQQINALQNMQVQQDMNINMMQETAIIQKQADLTESSDEEDLEDVKEEDIRLNEIKQKLEDQQKDLEQQMASLQQFVQVDQPVELKHQIEQLLFRIRELENRPLVVYEAKPVIEQINVTYNAGPLLSDRSNLDSDADIYARRQDEEIPESVHQSTHTEQESEIHDSQIIQNLMEAEFLQEEKTFHHTLKLKTKKQIQVPQEQVQDFKDRNLETLLDKVMTSELQLNLQQIGEKSEKELEQILGKLVGISTVKANFAPEVVEEAPQIQFKSSKIQKIEDPISEVIQKKPSMTFEDNQLQLPEKLIKKESIRPQSKVQFNLPEKELAPTPIIKKGLLVCNLDDSFDDDEDEPAIPMTIFHKAPQQAQTQQKPIHDFVFQKPSTQLRKQQFKFEESADDYDSQR